MATACIVKGSTGIRSAIIVLQFVALFVGFVVIHRLDSATQRNSATLAQHSMKLAQHDQQFEHILNIKFSREFAIKLREYLPHGQ